MGSEKFLWPVSRLAEAAEILGRKTGMISDSAELPLFPPLPDEADERTLEQGIEQISGILGIEVEAVETPYADITEMLARCGPALLSIPGTEGPGFLAVLKGGGRKLSVISPDLSVRKISLKDVKDALAHELESPLIPAIDRVLDHAGVPEERRKKARQLFLNEQLNEARIRGCRILRFSPGADFLKQILYSSVPRYLAMIVGLHILFQILTLAGWWIIGRSVFGGRFEWSWLWAWALTLFTGIPLQIAGVRAGMLFSASLGSLFKNRLLYGALKLEAEAVRHQGAGQFLSRVLESESLDSIAVENGFTAAIALIDLIIAAAILSEGAGGRFHTLSLFCWCIITFFMCWRYYLSNQNTIGSHREITNDLVERMVAHRTRSVQENRSRWHEDEDRILKRYLKVSERQDKIGIRLHAAISRGWMIIGLSGIAFAFVTGSESQAKLALSLGGILLAAQALSRIIEGITGISAAKTAWKQAEPLFRAGVREPFPRFFSDLSENKTDTRDQKMPLMLLKDIVFRYREKECPILQKLSLKIHKGDRILLEGPSGGGKSTLLSLMAGLNIPESGLLLLEGADRRSLGSEAWRKRVAAAPQFHENHILTETFAFNLLMGTQWPPRAEDLEEAEAICRELGLGDLLDRMPAGFQQMVGESGWRLSHGERSRIYIARALLQKADLIILDESFAALDPENLHRALSCVIRRANTLLVIAHP